MLYCGEQALRIVPGDLGRVGPGRQVDHRQFELVGLFPLVQTSGGRLPGGVGVEGQKDAVGEMAEEAEVILGERRAAGGDGALHPQRKSRSRRCSPRRRRLRLCGRSRPSPNSTRTGCAAWSKWPTPLSCDTSVPARNRRPAYPRASPARRRRSSALRRRRSGTSPGPGRNPGVDRAGSRRPTRRRAPPLPAASGRGRVRRIRPVRIRAGSGARRPRRSRAIAGTGAPVRRRRARAGARGKKRPPCRAPPEAPAVARGPRRRRDCRSGS